MKITISRDKIHINNELAAKVCADGSPMVLRDQVTKIHNKVLNCWILRHFDTGCWLAFIINGSNDDGPDDWIMVPPPTRRRNSDWTWQLWDGAAEEIRVWCEGQHISGMNLPWGTDQ